MVETTSVKMGEIEFCGKVQSWADSLFQKHPELPFGSARIESPGRGTRKRTDLQFFDRKGNPVLCGEVKMPGTPEGRNPCAPDLMQNAFLKAENLLCPYFFTWNVNTFVLFDRGKYKEPLLDRRVAVENLLLDLRRPHDVGRAEVLAYIRDKFLPQFFTKFADIYEDRAGKWYLEPDEFFIKSLESHLSWPMDLTRDWLGLQSEKDKPFSRKLEEWMAAEQQWTFTRSDPEEWRRILDRAARTLCYVFCNRLMFYESVRARWDSLPKLDLPRNTMDAEKIYDHFQKCFQEAVRTTGDYEPLFYPYQKDWAGPLIFRAPGVFEAWRSVLKNIRAYNLKSIPYDIVGKIFKRLISPEERHKFGQHFTHEDIVDVINAFCIRRPEALVLDPACGSGSFLVRAYHRKAWLSEQPIPSPAHGSDHKRHYELLQELFGCDIALFPAHLATLNLASRQIEQEDNYPQIARRNFFEIEPGKPFCKVPAARKPPGGSEPPGGLPRGTYDVPTPQFHAIVGNPPYVRQEIIPRKGQRGVHEAQTKEYLQELVSNAWPGLKLSGRSDLHCYFWPAACWLLTDNGYFGFLTSSSWLDVEYGFALQGWILCNFKLIAVIESTDEPWFEDARVKTCVTIIQRCADEKQRMENRVKFVRLNRPLAQILGQRDSETARQKAAEKLRKLIEGAKKDFADENMRIIVKSQRELWEDGVAAAKVVSAETGQRKMGTDRTAGQSPFFYGAGKWGRYLRAPDFYFEIVREFGDKFVQLGEIAEIRRGITSGCDAFFMPHDITEKVLKDCPDSASFKHHFGCNRKDLADGKLKIVKAGDGSQWVIESEYLAPEVHSLMQIDRPVVRAKDLDRVVLLVNKPKSELKGTWVEKYIKYGEKEAFSSTKSKSVPVPKRSTCAARPVWYDLQPHRIGLAFWPKSQQYRHIIPENSENLVCNCNLYDVHRLESESYDPRVLTAILNSTLAGLFKAFYGRYAGTEGNLKTEIVDVYLMEVPRPDAPRNVASRLLDAFDRLQSREVGHLVEKSLMDCHSPERARKLADAPLEMPEELRQSDRMELDDAVFELLGVADAKRRAELIDRLYEATVRHYRQIRIVEIQKMEQRSKTKSRRFSPDELASDIWDVVGREWKVPLVEWLAAQPGAKQAVEIPDSTAKLASPGHFYDALTVYFGKDRKVYQQFPHRPMAELVFELARAGVTGAVEVPKHEAQCAQALAALRKRLAASAAEFESLAGSRTGTERLQEEIVNLLKRWSAVGKGT
ncbi:MAG: N-6 DNA methylase [Planctomycetota bacterium]